MAITEPSIDQPDRTQDRMWSDILVPEEIVDVRARAREAAAAAVLPHADEIANQVESRAAFPWAAFKGLADAGMYSLPFTAEHGGAGLTDPMLATCTMVEELAYVSSSMAGVIDGQCLLVGASLRQASPAVQARYVPGIISGELVGCFATTEPDASSDLSVEALKTTCEADGDGFVITGLKRWITNSVVGDLVVTLCRTGDGMSMVIVPLKDTPGLTVGEPDRKLGHRGQITADIRFDGVRVPAENVIGEPGRGLRVALTALAYGRIGIGAAGVGVAQAALDLAVQRLRTRTAFGKKLGEMQYWQYRLAERAIELEAARALYQKAALRLDREGPSDPEASMAKVLGTRLANDLARDAIQIHGGYGFAREIAATGERPRLEAIYRDAKILEIFEGANEVLLWVIARHLIGRDVTG